MDTAAAGLAVWADPQAATESPAMARPAMPMMIFFMIFPLFTETNGPLGG